MAWIEKKRALRSVVYQDDAQPNKYSLDATITPLHYESSIDSGIADTRVDMTPQRINNATLNGWRATGNSWHFALGQPGGGTPASGNDGWVGFGGRQGAHWLQFRLERVGYLHWPTLTWNDIGGAPSYVRARLSQETRTYTLPTTGESVPNETAATWNRIWATPAGGQIDISWRAHGDGLKELIFLNQAGRDWIATNRPPTTPLTETYFGFAFRLDHSDIPRWYKSDVLNDLTDLDDDGQTDIKARDALDRLLFLLPVDDACILDGDGVEVWRQRLRKRIYQDGATTWLLVGIRADMLNAAPAGTIVFDPSIDDQVASSGDDGHWTNGGGYSSTDPYFIAGSWYGTPYNMWARFAVADIASGDTITLATLSVWQYGTGGSGTLLSNIYCIAEDDATAPTSYADASGRSLTTAFITWDGYTTGSDGDQFDSDDMSSVVQEVVDRAGWAADNHLVVMWKDDGTAGGAPNGFIGDTTNGAATSPAIHIEYTAGGGPADLLVNVSDAISVAESVAFETISFVAVSDSINGTDAVALSVSDLQIAILESVAVGESVTAKTVASVVSGGLNAGLISYWRLNEESGTRIDKRSTSDLTDNNTVGFATGKQSNAADFVESNSEYLSIASNSELAIGDRDFTFAFWFNLSTLGTGAAQRWLLSKDGVTSGREYVIRTGQAGGTGLVFDLYNGTTTRVARINEDLSLILRFGNVEIHQGRRS